MPRTAKERFIVEFRRQRYRENKDIAEEIELEIEASNTTEAARPVAKDTTQ